MNLSVSNSATRMLICIAYVLGCLVSPALSQTNTLYPADHELPSGTRVTEDILYNWQILGPIEIDKKYFAPMHGKNALHAPPHVDIQAWQHENPPSMDWEGKSYHWVNAPHLYERVYVGYRAFIPGGLMPYYSVMFLHTTIHVKEKLEDVRIRLGSDDYCLIYIDGTPFTGYSASNRGFQRDDTESPPLTLEPGSHHIVVKLVNEKGGAGFGMRFVDAQGRAIRVQAPNQVPWPMQPRRNALRNASFELGLSHWALFEGGPETDGELVKVEDAPDGEHVLRLSNLSEALGSRLYTHWIRLDPMADQYTFKVRARALEGDVTVRAGIMGPRSPKFIGVQRDDSFFSVEAEQKLTDQWQTITATGRLVLSPRDNYRVMIMLFGSGAIELDGVSVTLAGDAHEFKTHEPLEMGLVDHTGSLGIMDDEAPAAFAVRTYAQGESVPRPKAVRVDLQNLDGTTIAAKRSELSYSGHGRGETIVTFQSLPIGFYQVNAHLMDDSGEVVLREQVSVAVVDSQLDRPRRDDGFLGLHMGRLAPKPYTTARVQKMMGVQVIRVADFPAWHFIEPRRNEFNWSVPTYVQAAYDQGIGLIGHLVGIPPWASVRGMKNPPGKNHARPPRDHDLYRDRIFQMVSRYKHMIHVWEHWNEPDLRNNWTSGPKAYVELLAAASDAVFKADPNAILTGANLCTPRWSWYDQAIDAGLFEHINAFGIHGYGQSAPESWIGTLNKMRSLLREADKSMPLIISEVGKQGGRKPLPSEATYLRVGADYPDERAHAALLARSMAIALAHDVQTLAWYKWNRTSYNPSGLDPYGIMMDFPTPHPIPAVLSYNAAAATLHDVDSGKRLDAGQPDVYVYEFLCENGAKAWAAWTTREESVDYVLKVEQPEAELSVRPALSSPAVVGDHTGQLKLQLTSEPVFVRQLQSLEK